MLLQTVTVENFRGIKKVVVELSETTVLIGENNSGKTSFLHAIRYCLEKIKSKKGFIFDEYDFHLSAPDKEPSTAAPIMITLEFRESEPDEWEDELVRTLGDVINERDDELREIVLKVTCQFDNTLNDFSQDWVFLDTERNPHTGKATRSTLLTNLQQIRPVFYLSALRDAGREFSGKSSFWGPFLRQVNIAPELKKELEEELSKINEKIVETHESFDHVRTHLRKLQEVVSVGTRDVVSIDAVPAKLFDILSKTQVNLASVTGAKLPVAKHGEGTQSLSVLMLFDAFLKARLTSSYDKLAKPVIALEEPEAHLHPCAIRSLWQSITSLSGQKIVASHSGDLLAEVPLLSVRRFCRKSDQIEVLRVKDGILNAEEMRKFNYHIRRSRGELLFARCWLLGEGETEVTIFQECARVLGLDLERYGVRCVDYRSSDIEYFVKIANELGIEWHCIIDNDGQGAADRKKMLGHLNGLDEKDRITVLPCDNMDVYLSENGFGDIYESYLSEQLKKQVTVAKGDPQYWIQVCRAVKSYKVKAALDVTFEMHNKGNSAVPGLLIDILKKSMTLAGWSAS
jgi:putative ATP-dependent endonuclease of OLD family